MKQGKTFAAVRKTILATGVFLVAHMFFWLFPGAYASSETFTRTGFFYIPHSGIYTEWINEPNSGYWQNVVDGRASLLIDADALYPSPIITDHSYQDFSNLANTQTGDEAVMILNDGSEINYRCIDVIEGENTAKDLLTLSGQSVFSVYDADLVLYTCHYNRFSVNGVLIAVWQIYEPATA